MRICLFTPNFLPAVGGTEIVSASLARAWHAAGHEPVVLALGPPHDGGQVDEPYPVHWYRKPLFPRLYPERIQRSLRRLLSTTPADIVVANYGVPTGYAAIQHAKHGGPPVVVISHGGDLYRSSKDRNRPHLWRRTVEAYQQAQGLAVISPYVEELVREINPSPRQLEYIPNGIDLAEFQQPAPRPTELPFDSPFILCLGNLGEMKGFADAIAAFSDAKRGLVDRGNLGDLKLVIAGDGPLEAPLKQQAAKSAAAADIHFLGRRVGDDKRWLLQNCAFGAAPSIEEGHPIVGLEFLASGKPLVCSTNAAFDHMYDDGVNAYRVPAEDRQALAGAFIRMVDADRQAMGAESLSRSGSYDWTMIAQRYIAFFERVVADSPRQ